MGEFGTSSDTLKVSGLAELAGLAWQALVSEMSSSDLSPPTAPTLAHRYATPPTRPYPTSTKAAELSKQVAAATKAAERATSVADKLRKHALETAGSPLREVTNQSYLILPILRHPTDHIPSYQIWLRPIPYDGIQFVPPRQFLPRRSYSIRSQAIPIESD